MISLSISFSFYPKVLIFIIKKNNDDDDVKKVMWDIELLPVLAAKPISFVV